MSDGCAKAVVYAKHRPSMRADQEETDRLRCNSTAISGHSIVASAYNE